METLKSAWSELVSFRAEKVGSVAGSGNLYKIASSSTPDVRVFEFSKAIPVSGREYRPVALSWDGYFTPRSVARWLAKLDRDDLLSVPAWTIEVWPGETPAADLPELESGAHLTVEFSTDTDSPRHLEDTLEAHASRGLNATVSMSPAVKGSTVYIWGALASSRRVEHPHMRADGALPGRADAEVGIRLAIDELDRRGGQLVLSLLAMTSLPKVGIKADVRELSRQDIGGLIHSLRAALGAA